MLKAQEIVSRYHRSSTKGGLRRVLGRSSNRLMTKFDFPVTETDFHPFKRWLRARDPKAILAVRPAHGELWIVSVTTAKAYLVRLSERRWRAAGT